MESVDPQGRQWAAIGPDRAIGCTVYPAAEIIAPGVVRHTYGDRYVLRFVIHGVDCQRDC